VSVKGWGQRSNVDTESLFSLTVVCEISGPDAAQSQFLDPSEQILTDDLRVGQDPTHIGEVFFRTPLSIIVQLLAYHVLWHRDVGSRVLPEGDLAAALELFDGAGIEDGGRGLLFVFVFAERLAEQLQPAGTGGGRAVLGDRKGDFALFADAADHQKGQVALTR
jgi:hypothetical protein